MMNIFKRWSALCMILAVCSLVQVATVKEQSLTTCIGPRISQLQIKKGSANQSDRRPNTHAGREVHIIRASDHQKHQEELNALLGQLNINEENPLAEEEEGGVEELTEEEDFSVSSSSTTSTLGFELVTTSTTPRPRKDALLEPLATADAWTSHLRLTVIILASAIALVHLLIGPLRKCMWSFSLEMTKWVIAGVAKYTIGGLLVICTAWEFWIQITPYLQRIGSITVAPLVWSCFSPFLISSMGLLVAGGIAGYVVVKHISELKKIIKTLRDEQDSNIYGMLLAGFAAKNKE